VRDRTAVALGMIGGALAGAAAGWLLLTRDGQRLRGQLEPRLRELADHAMAIGESVRRMQSATRESWGTVQDVAGQTPER
jgi:gas vesicle protein